MAGRTSKHRSMDKVESARWIRTQLLAKQLKTTVKSVAVCGSETETRMTSLS